MILVGTAKCMVSNGKVEVTFEPVSRKMQVQVGTTILQAVKEAGISLTAECGGKGICGKCKVIVRKPEDLSELTEPEKRHLLTSEISQGYRLACQARVLRNTTITLPSESYLGVRRIQAMGLERFLLPQPAITKVHIKMSKPTLTDVRPDYERLVDMLPVDKRLVEIDYEVFRGLPTTLRGSDFDVTVAIWSGRKIISVEAGDSSKNMFGLAVDIGTSKIVCHLVD
ncbi:MAG: 2Fe-2S iron-sulfur cluster-binding protein, partial [Candidatus Bathyarchaeia archaeon]